MFSQIDSDVDSNFIDIDGKQVCYNEELLPTCVYFLFNEEHFLLQYYGGVNCQLQFPLFLSCQRKPSNSDSHQFSSTFVLIEFLRFSFIS